MQIQIDPHQVDQIIQKWHHDPSYLIEMLQDVQEAYRHLPREALARIAHKTRTDLGRLYHIATFYKAFSLKPRGELAVQICMGTACHVRGAKRVMDACVRELKIEPGETTQDLRFTLEGVRCVGCCSLAPVVTVGKDLHGEVNSSQVGRLLKRYRPKTAAAKSTQEVSDA